MPDRMKCYLIVFRNLAFNIHKYLLVYKNLCIRCHLLTSWCNMYAHNVRQEWNLTIEITKSARNFSSFLWRIERLSSLPSRLSVSPSEKKTHCSMIHFSYSLYLFKLTFFNLCIKRDFFTEERATNCFFYRCDSFETALGTYLTTHLLV